MFGSSKKRDAAIVEAVCARLRPLIGILEQQLKGLPSELIEDPYVIGYVISAATIFTQIETQGKGSTELRGLTSISALQSVFAAHQLSQQQAGAVMQKFASHPEMKRGGRAADLVLGVAAGFTDRDHEPEIVAAKQAVASMPRDIREMLGGTPQSLLVGELQDQLFFEPLVRRYGRQ